MLSSPAERNFIVTCLASATRTTHSAVRSIYHLLYICKHTYIYIYYVYLHYNTAIYIIHMQFKKYVCTKTSINCLMSQNHAHRPLLTPHLTPLPFFSGMRVTILILGRGGFATHSSLVTQLVSTVILGGLGEHGQRSHHSTCQHRHLSV